MIDNMMLTLPIFLLISFGIVLWLLVWARGHWFTKATYIATVFSTIGILWLSIPSFFGWSAYPMESIYNKPVTVLGVYIEEPSPNSDGGIHLTLYSRSEDHENYILKIFGHPIEAGKPRLYRLPYSRELHKNIVEMAMPGLSKGNPVTGIITKGQGDGQGDVQGDGDGSPSQSQELKFYNLQPSEILPKTETPEGSTPEPLNKREVS